MGIFTLISFLIILTIIGLIIYTKKPKKHKEKVSEIRITKDPSCDEYCG
jgi:competence protein ComGC